MNVFLVTCPDTPGAVPVRPAALRMVTTPVGRVYTWPCWSCEAQHVTPCSERARALLQALAVPTVDLADDAELDDPARAIFLAVLDEAYVIEWVVRLEPDRASCLPLTPGTDSSDLSGWSRAGAWCRDLLDDVLGVRSERRGSRLGGGRGLW